MESSRFESIPLQHLSGSEPSVRDKSGSYDHTHALLSTFSTNETAAHLGTHSSPKLIFHIALKWIRRQLPEGWRFGATVGMILSLCALIGNIIVLIMVSTSVDDKDGRAWNFVTIRHGPCSDIEHIQLGIHLVINTVSTLLLGASNYCMQCLSAPTREEVNSAHQRGKYLDIGVPSLRNLRVIKRGRLTCWLLLGLSSLPLHLIYNSTFYVSIVNNSYDIYIASHGFEKGEWFDNDLFSDFQPVTDSLGNGYRNRTIHFPNGTAVSDLFDEAYQTRPSGIQEQISRLGIRINGSVFEKLENADCIDAYARTPLPDRRTLVLVSSTRPRDNHQLDDQSDYYTGEPFTYTFGNCTTSRGLPITIDGGTSLMTCLGNSSLYTVVSYRSGLLTKESETRSNWFAWICSQDDSLGDLDTIDTTQLCGDGHWQTIRRNSSQWTVHGFEIDYCISEKLENGCKLNMAGGLLIVIIAFNAMKVVIMGLVVWKIHGEQIITIGDAAASFIQEPDPTTKGLCLYSREDFYDSTSGRFRYSEAKPFELRAKRRATAASRRRWIFVTILVLLGLGVILGLLGYAIIRLKSNHGVEGFQSLWNLGIGTLNSSTLFGDWDLPTSGDGAVISAVLVANTPQALFSMLYMLINGLFTSLSLAAEWSRYAYRSTPLRVSKQRGNQRSTYFLQVPYRLAIPLMAFTAFLHWIISQSIFFTQVEARDPSGVPSDSNHVRSEGPTTCSYSPLAIIITAIAGFALMVFAAALGWRKLQSGIPLAGSCSAAISAACHSPERTSALLPVMWGVIPDMKEETADGEQVGHCAFSNDPVEAPVEGNLYA